MPKYLVIVESPAKARTIGGFLGADFVVDSSMGHIRDLPAKGLNVDTEHDFAVEYEVHATKKDTISRLKKALKGVDELLLATDEDREGEAISWHLLEVLQPKVPVRRMVFHEITQAAIEHAIENSRDVDYGLVDAQESRRIVDRLYGYPVSEVVWRKIRQGLSAGRVQSPSVRLVVDRERERMAFVAASYWDLSAAFPTEPGFTAGLVTLDGSRVAGSRDFDSTGRTKRDDVAVLDEAGAQSLRAGLAGQPFTVTSVETKPYTSRPKPPFITSTLQQVGGSRLRMSARQVMSIAQGLYEEGYITYMRTDSTTLSDTAIKAARQVIERQFGREYLTDGPRVYAKKAKNAQEAHEAIRPAGDAWRSPDQLRGELRGDQLRVYELIWQRTLASQMPDARGSTVTARIGATTSDGVETEWTASGRTITFPGWQAVYGYGGEDDASDSGDEATAKLPALTEGQALPTPAVDAEGHTTQPPARYTEATLVKRLEELGIGRPSTYASIMQTIQDRGYVWKKGQALVPTTDAFAVVTLLEQHFQHLVDYEFTARMEDDLDEIAGGRQARVPWLHKFWFGNGEPGVAELKAKALEEADAAAINTIPLGVDEHGEPIVIRNGKFGPYLKRGEDTASLPEDLPLDELTIDKAVEILSAPKGGEPLGADPETGLPVYAKQGRFGPYVQLGDADTLPPDTKPKMSSLFQTMTLSTITLDEALQLLSLPRVVGEHPEGGEIVASNGKFGPYLKWKDETRSLDSEEKLLTVELDEAVKVLAEPKKFGRRKAAPAPPLKELGNDPVSEKPVVVKDGRFGPYVTDGETNASLRKGDTIEDITIERAAELLQMRREAGPAKKGGRKAAAKKAPAKKAAAKKKPAAKKAVAKAVAKKAAPKNTDGA
ncbi:MAG TPA: type I DNA topoisomerase [Acidimicrobiales bacterium]|jgi:DNA topoisomerase-1|nr:type I DNA topoisomerase [Acidimicrobiales bacterium]